MEGWAAGALRGLSAAFASTEADGERDEPAGRNTGGEILAFLACAREHDEQLLSARREGALPPHGQDRPAVVARGLFCRRELLFGVGVA
jgi:hypothetical protein